MPLSLRKANLARPLMRCAAGIFIAEYEQRKIGDVLFRVECDGFSARPVVSSHAIRSPAERRPTLPAQSKNLLPVPVRSESCPGQCHL